MSRSAPVLTTALLLLAACGGAIGESRPQGGPPSAATVEGALARGEERECPAPIGKIVMEDCANPAVRYDDGAFGQGSTAGASYRGDALHQADGAVTLLAQKRRDLCEAFNGCKLSVAEYRAGTQKLDTSYTDLLAVRDTLAALDARGAAFALEEVSRIRSESVGGAPPSAPAAPPATPVAAPAPPPSGPASPLVGSYAITASANPGQPPGGLSYRGSVHITQQAAAVMLTWHIGNGQEYQGIGLEAGGVLHVAWSTVDSKRIGIAAYPLTGGRMNGIWTMTGTGGRTGTEVLQGSPSLTGEYQITEGRFGGTDPYTGKVTLTPTGQTYGVAWSIGADVITGVGLKVGNTFGAAYGVEPNQDYGIVSYVVKGNVLEGVWALRGGRDLGYETLTRQ